MDIKKHVNEASLGEFMKISLEGFSWAENICQKIENICTENNMVQNPGKYVNAVGEHFKKVIHTVVNDLCDHADDVLELFSDLSLGHASLVKASGKKGEELGGALIHERPSACICREETVSMENISLEHDTVPNVLENLGSGPKKNTSDEIVFTSSKLDKAFSSTEDSFSEHQDGTLIHERPRVEIEENASVEKYSCVRFEPEVRSVEDMNQVKSPNEPQFLNKKDVSTAILMETPMLGAEGLNCSAKNFFDAAAFDVNLTRSLSLTETNSSMTNHIRIGGPSPFHSICNLDLESQEASCLLESNGSEIAWEKEHKDGEVSTKYENSNIFSWEEFGNSSIFSLKNEDLSEFEDVKLEDDFEEVKVENDWDDMVKTEIALISSLVAKKDSSKKNLKKMFTSRWRPSRGKELVTYHADLHSKTSSDSDWELL